MITQLANQYFSFIAKRFPVMCASDEFHFLPRAEKAAAYYDKTDNLEAKSIQHTIHELKQIRDDFSRLAKTSGLPLESKIDLDLLMANISGILLEIENKKSFENNPLLYLKIAFIGLDHALNRPSGSPTERMDRTSSRLHAIPALLEQGITNLSTIPKSFYEHAILMAADCKEYLKKAVTLFFHKTDLDSLLEQGIKKALEAVDSFQKFLLSQTPVPDNYFSSDTLDTCLRDHFLYSRSLNDIFQIAVEEWNDNLKNLEHTAKKINPNIPWMDLYQNTLPHDMGDISIISRYRTEAKNIGNFFASKGVVKKNQYVDLTIAETPVYLRSVRGSASFAASLTSDTNEKDIFYITTSRDNSNNPEATKLLAERLHREYIFLTAHETIPGHLFLDGIRRKLENPVRRQIESPLFYEGWATYAETLLADYGYFTHPHDLLVDFRRRLWRAARCQIDVGLSTGKLDREGAVRLLTITGFSKQEATNQVNRFRINPGYQLCYCLGSYEFTALKKRYIHRLGDKLFHDVLLKGGELPFHLIEKRLENVMLPQK
jgi:hypothetical protein